MKTEFLILDFLSYSANSLLNLTHFRELSLYRVSTSACYLSEQRSVEGDGVETVHRPHGDVQVHEQPLLLLSVHCGTNPLREHGGKENM